MVNIIYAIMNLLENPIVKLNDEYVNKRNRANNMGKALEEYVKDIFAGTINMDNSIKRLEKMEESFSYAGNQNNPPDFMIKGGDAIEVKKIERPNASLALNSSYPKNKLYFDNPMLTKSCKECEEWKEKDIIYAVGVVGKDKKTLTSLAFIYGEDYAASEDVYKKIWLKIKDRVTTTDDIEFKETKELGKVDMVDPLGITYLRIRSMWGIENPFRAFEYVFSRDYKYNFNFMAIINEKKWKSLDGTEDLKKLIDKTDGANLINGKIKNPDNPVKLKNAYIITFQI